MGPPVADAPGAGGIEIRAIARRDIFACLAAGGRDFRAAPACGLGVGASYAAAGWTAIVFARFSGLTYLAYPFLTGFALVGPFMAAALYEVEFAAWKPASRWARAGCLPA